MDYRGRGWRSSEKSNFIRSSEKFLSFYEEIIDAQRFLFYIILFYIITIYRLYTIYILHYYGSILYIILFCW